MNELHTMPLKVEKLLSSKNYRRMKWDEKGAYLVLLAEAWLDGARLENNPDGIRELLGISEDIAWSRIKKFVIEKMFAPSEDGQWLVNPTQAEIYQDTLDLHNRLAEAGRKGGFRKAEAKKIKSDYSPATARLQPGSGNQSQSQSQNQSQREIQDAHAHQTAQEPFVPYPQNWQEVRQEAENIGYPMPQPDCENFLAKWQAKGWKDGQTPIMDWRRLLMTWKNNAGRFAEGVKTAPHILKPRDRTAEYLETAKEGGRL